MSSPARTPCARQFAIWVWCLAFALPAGALDTGAALQAVFDREVPVRLEPPPEAVADYRDRLALALRAAGLWPLPSQYFVLVDRSPQVQALLVFWQSGAGELHLVGAAPCSTGQPGRYEHFETPAGVFDHSVRNPDFRSEGTLNENGIRGYGAKGMRVFDFGWVAAPRGWGDRHAGVMRLQLHATDPDLLEPRLGSACSKGCIRVAAAVNVFLDRYGILDADYEDELAVGRRPRVLRKDRAPTPWSGRYLVVTDSRLAGRPEWARVPPREPGPPP